MLLVDDDETLRKVLVRELTELGLQVRDAADAVHLARRVTDERPDVLLLDLKLPGKDGMTALAEALQADPDLPVVVLTGHGTVQEAVQAMQVGAYDFLTKPVRMAVLEQTLRRAGERRALSLENRRLRRMVAPALDPLATGDSQPMRALRQRIERVARSDGNVLVLGENGTGKELIARSIHAVSRRSQHPFVVVNCGAIPDNLVNSELFGHVRGAFTGADRARTGLFEAADGGTLFLDEIGDLPREVQPALLRAIQFGEVRPVGSDEVRHVDVRAVAATNRDLGEMVRSGEFREDLYYRLATLELRVPPLRERGDDIPVLAATFLRRQMAAAGRPLQLTDDAVARLRRHTWPGNVRELENVVTRLAVMVDGERIGADDIERCLSQPGREVGELPTLDLHDLERRAIEMAMVRFDGDKRRAAEALGIALKTLYNKLARMKDSGGGED